MPSDKCPALVERFRTDSDCRVFLSTYAGAVGLDLLHASMLVNMDLPWNPVPLEQRIGRIHRMGQMRPVQIVNFVGKGTIEEGMLSVLAFEHSLSAGILDGGKSEISLGGSRLNRQRGDSPTFSQRFLIRCVGRGRANERGSLPGQGPIDPGGRSGDHPVIRADAGPWRIGGKSDGEKFD